MPPVPAYRFLISGEAFRESLTMRAAERQALDDAFQFLAEHPFHAGDYQERDEDGRAIEVWLQGRFVLTYWADHAVRELRVVRVERV